MFSILAHEHAGDDVPILGDLVFADGTEASVFGIRRIAVGAAEDVAQRVLVAVADRTGAVTCRGHRARVAGLGAATAFGVHNRVEALAAAEPDG